MNEVICGNGKTLRVSGATICGDNNVIIGDGNRITGDRNRITGDGNRITGDSNRITGDGNNVYGNSNVMTGDGNRAQGNSNRMANSNDGPGDGGWADVVPVNWENIMQNSHPESRNVRFTGTIGGANVSIVHSGSGVMNTTDRASSRSDQSSDIMIGGIPYIEGQAHPYIQIQRSSRADIDPNSGITPKMPARIVDEPSAAEGESECKICMDRSVKCLMRPCNHTVCNTCCWELSKHECPFCKTPFVEVERFYL